MTQPDFRLLGGNNALASFGTGLQLGQQMRDRQEYREHQNALLAAQQQREARLDAQAQRQAQQAEETERRADLPLLGKLLDYSKDEQTYQQARSVAQRYGIDMSQVPETFDPNWIAQQRQVVQLLQSPQGQEALSTAGKQAVDMGFTPGTPEFQQATTQLVEAALAQAYTGSQGETRLFTPKVGQAPSAPPPGLIEDGYRFKGGNPADPANWEAVMSDQQGGQALNAAQQAQTITAEEAARVRQSLGPNGQAAFEQWMRDNNIVIGAR